MRRASRFFRTHLETGGKPALETCSLHPRGAPQGPDPPAASPWLPDPAASPAGRQQGGGGRGSCRESPLRSGARLSRVRRPADALPSPRAAGRGARRPGTGWNRTRGQGGGPGSEALGAAPSCLRAPGLGGMLLFKEASLSYFLLIVTFPSLSWRRFSPKGNKPPAPHAPRGPSGEARPEPRSLGSALAAPPAPTLRGSSQVPFGAGANRAARSRLYTAGGETS